MQIYLKKQIVLIMVLLGVSIQSCSAQVPKWDKLSTMFAYNKNLPFEVKERHIEDRGIARIHDITYASPMGGDVPAYLVIPDRKGPFAAVLFLHPGQGDRSISLPEAVTLAQLGVVSLLIDAPYMRPVPWTKRYLDTEDPVHSRDSVIQTVVDLRRGIDLVVSRGDVDSERIAYIGHSLGATIGGVLAGVDKRPKTYILMAGQPVHSRWWQTSGHPVARQVRKSVTEAKLDRYVDVMSSVDAIHYIGHAAPATLFFQFAKEDVFISKDEACQYFNAARESKSIEWYNSDHGMNEQARKDRTEWLKRQLNLNQK